jgi:hypothetical protein
MISPSASWSVLGRPDVIRATAPPGANLLYLNTWTTTLSRALGLSADADHFRFADGDDRRTLRNATLAAGAIAPSFIQYARADDALVEEIHRQLYEIRGYDRIGILYRDSEKDGAGGDAGGKDPGLERRLYGPALSDEFRPLNRADGTIPRADTKDRRPDLAARRGGGASGGLVYLDSPFNKAPSRSERPNDYSKAFADWETGLEDQLRPILRVFERERVGAVGVFGNSAEEKVAVLKFVRKHMPGVQLFTSDPDWKLESSSPPRSAMEGGAIPAAARTEDYPLNGLLVFAAAVPENDWVRLRFQELNEVAVLGGGNTAFLPDVFDGNAAHIVKRLIDLAGQGRFDLLDLGPDAAGQANREALEAFLRDRTSIGDSRIQHSESAASLGDRQVLMIISNGRLHPMNEPKWLNEHGAVFVGLLLILISLFWFIRSGRPVESAPDAEPRTLWEQVVGAPTPAVAATRPAPRPTAPPAPGDDQARTGAAPARSLGSLRLPAILAALLLLPIGAVVVDDRLFDLQTSPSLLPDGQSVLPTLVLFVVVAFLAIRLPYDFKRQIEWFGRKGRYRTSLLLDWSHRDQGDRADEARFIDCILAWKGRWVDPQLKRGAHLGSIAGGVALGLTLLDAWYGLPVAFPSLTWLVAFVYEFGVLLAVLSTALIFGDMVRAVMRLKDPSTFRTLGNDGEPGTTKALRMMDPESLRRLGTVFINIVANALLIFTLLLVSRLPWLGMARWRWSLPVSHWWFILPELVLLALLGLAYGATHSEHGAIVRWLRVALVLVVVVSLLGGLSFGASHSAVENPLPLGAILFTVGLLYIIGYWYQCHTTFRTLIRQVKDARLAQLWERRLAAEHPEPEPAEPSEEEPEEGGDFEERRQVILAIPDDPWAPEGSWRARVALLTTIATPIVSLFLGTWADVIGKTLNSLFGR